jgi:hypothetical protein
MGIAIAHDQLFIAKALVGIISRHQPRRHAHRARHHYHG